MKEKMNEMKGRNSQYTTCFTQLLIFYKIYFISNIYICYYEIVHHIIWHYFYDC